LHTAFDDSTDLDYTLTWVLDGRVTSSEHNLGIEYYLDAGLIDQETGVLVTSTMNYLHSVAGEGGATEPSTKQANIKVMLLDSASGNLLSSYETLRDDLLF
jgi:hypothetical protein